MPTSRATTEFSSSTAAVSENDSPLSEMMATMPSFMSRGLLYLCLLFLGVGVVYTAIGKVDVVKSAPAKVVPEGRLKTVQTDIDGVVTEVRVKEGDRVRAGDVLAVVDSRDVVTILATLRTAERALDDVKREIEELVPLKEKQFDARIAILREKIGSLSRRTTALEERMTKEEEGLALAKRQHELELQKQDEVVKRLRVEHENAVAGMTLYVKERAAMLRLLELDAASELQVLAAQRNYDKAKGEIEKLESMITEAERNRAIQDVSLQNVVNKHEKGLSQIREAIEENAAQRQTTELEILTMQNELEVLKLETYKKRDMFAFKHQQARRLAALNLSGIVPEVLDRIASGTENETDQAIVQSPVDGIVGSVAATNGMTVQRAAVLLTIVPEGAVLQMEIRIPNKDVGLVRTGQTARLKFDAFPFADHGTINGELLRIVNVAEEKPQQQAAQSYYRAYCSMEQDYFRVEGEERRLLPGMTATAEIVTERKTILQLLLKPFMKLGRGAPAEN